MLSALVLSGCVRSPYDTAAPAPSDVVETEEPEEQITGNEPAPEEETVSESGNLIPGADLMNENSDWGLYTESGGSASMKTSGGKLTVHIADPGRVGHAVQLYCGGFEMLEGGRYHFEARISSDVPRTFEWRIQVNGGDYHPYSQLKDVEIGPEAKVITCDLTMNEPSDPAPRMCFNLGDEGEKQGLEEHNVTMDSISLELENAGEVKPAELSGELKNINVNQIGYLPVSDKRAVVRYEGERPSDFDVVSADGKNVVYSGNLSDGIDKGSSGDRVVYADFSALTAPGKYRIRVAGAGESYDFTIGSDVFDSALTDTLRMFYLQRCGSELGEDLAGDFSHSACHTDEARVYGGNRYVDVSGGWHDAGDYGKYVGPGAVTVGHLLYAWKLFPDGCSDILNIPESGNGIPDILNEARYELDWLLKMQRSDGAFHHKLTKDHFAPFIMPQDDLDPEYLMPVSHCATASASACLALASRIYSAYDSDFSAAALSAAVRGWTWLEENHDFVPFRNPDGVRTGGYGERTDSDDRFWAACELFASTGEERFRISAEALYREGQNLTQFGWADVGGMGALCCLFDLKNRAGDILYSSLQEDFLRQSETALLLSAASGYGTSISPDRYVWGSILPIMSNAVSMILNFLITGREDMRNAAMLQWNYALGMNALDRKSVV